MRSSTQGQVHQLQGKAIPRSSELSMSSHQFARSQSSRHATCLNEVSQPPLPIVHARRLMGDRMPQPTWSFSADLGFFAIRLVYATPYNRKKMGSRGYRVARSPFALCPSSARSRHSTPASRSSRRSERAVPRGS